MADNIGYLKRRAHTLRMGLFQRLDEICVSDFPTGSPKEVIKLIQDILEKIAAEVDGSTDEQTLGLICRTIQVYGQLLEYFDNAHTEQTPRGLAQLLEELIKQLTPEAKLLVWPQSSYNYSIRDILPVLQGTTANLLADQDRQALFGPFQGPIKLISFPRIERDDILMHAIFGHELGHPIADDYLRDEQATKEYNESLKNAIAEIDSVFAPQFKGLSTFDLFTRKKKLTDLLLQVRSRGLQEVVSDCVAILLFGPSALFALYDLFSSGNVDTVPTLPELYPPPRYRIRLTKEVMDQEGYSASLMALGENSHLGQIDLSTKEMLGYIDKISASNADIVGLEKDPLLKIAYDWLNQSLPNAIEYAKKRIAPLICDSSQIQNEIPGLLDRIALGIPPNEIEFPPNSKPVDWRSAIIAAWLCKIHGKKKAGKIQETMSAGDIEHLQKITLRAVEYILLQKRYSAYMASC